MEVSGDFPQCAVSDSGIGGTM